METGYSGAGGYYVDTLGKNANRVFRRTPGNSLLGVIRKSTDYAVHIYYMIFSQTGCNFR